MGKNVSSNYTKQVFLSETMKYPISSYWKKGSQLVFGLEIYLMSSCLKK